MENPTTFSSEKGNQIRGLVYLDFDGTLTAADEEGYYHTTGFLKFLTRKGYTGQSFWEQDKKDWEKYNNSEKTPEDYELISKRVLTNLAEALKGKSLTDVEGWQNEYAQENTRVFTWVSEVIQILNNNAYAVHVVSGAATPAIAGIVRKIGISEKNIHTTSFETKDNKYTGTIAHIFNFETKKQLVESLLKNNPDLPSIAIGDSSGDFPMLQAVKQAILYEAAEKYQSVAKEYGWYLVDHHTISSTIKNMVK